MEEKQKKVGIFHRDELNRKGLTKLLSEEFECEEIESWDGVSASECGTIIIWSPRLLYSSVSHEAIVARIERLKANVIMIDSDERQWWSFRTHYVRLRSPCVDMIERRLGEFHPQKIIKRGLFKRRKSA